MTKPLKIVIGNNIYPPFMAGGAELIVSYLAEGLVRRGHQVSVLTTCAERMEPYPVEVVNGVEILRFFPKNMFWNWDREPHPSWKKALWHLRDAWNPDTGKRFEQLFGDQPPDILHTHLLDGLSATLWQRAKSLGTRVIHTAHDYHLLCPRALMLTKSQKICTDPTLACRGYRKFHLETTKYVDMFCSPSNFLIELHKQDGLRSPLSAVVSNGVPLPEVKQKARAPGQPKRFLFAARHTIEKGCMVVLEAIKKMPRDVAVEFLIAGKGPLENLFHEAAAQDSRVQMLGYIQGETKTETFYKTDCFLIPSLWYENAPVVIVEAAAYGCGIIGSDLGALPEFIKHERTGLLFEPGDADALVAAMLRVVNEPDLLPRFRDHGRDLVAVSGVEHMIDSYLAQYERLLHG